MKRFSRLERGKDTAMRSGGTVSHVRSHPAGSTVIQSRLGTPLSSGMGLTITTVIPIWSSYSKWKKSIQGFETVVRSMVALGDIGLKLVTVQCYSKHSSSKVILLADTEWHSTSIGNIDTVQQLNS